MRSILTTCVVVLFVAGFASSDQTPHVMSFQGRLSDGLGHPVPDDSRAVLFRIYDDSTGGNVLWSESQTIRTVDGAFTVQLGSVNPLNTETFAGSPRYLGITVGTEAEISPRSALGAVPYAFQAGAVASLSGSDDLTPGTQWIAPYFRAIDGSPVLALTVISVYNADTTSNLVTLSFYTESGTLIDECSQTVARGAVWMFKSNQGFCPNVANHEGFVKVTGSGPVAPAGVFMTGPYGSQTLSPASASLTFFKL